MKQSRFIPWLGGFLVQLTNSFFYVTALNTGMIIITFWYTSGSIIANKYAPWMTLWHFFAICLVVIGAIMFFDYKYMYPSRQGFLNAQACKHPNPAMESLIRLESDVEKIKKRLGIDD